MIVSTWNQPQTVCPVFYWIFIRVGNLRIKRFDGFKQVRLGSNSTSANIFNEIIAGSKSNELFGLIESCNEESNWCIKTCTLEMEEKNMEKALRCCKHREPTSAPIVHESIAYWRHYGIDDFVMHWCARLSYWDWGKTRTPRMLHINQITSSSTHLCHICLFATSTCLREMFNICDNNDNIFLYNMLIYLIAVSRRTEEYCPHIETARVMVEGNSRLV